MRHDDVIQFWFGELTYKEWFQSSPELDQKIRDRFGATHAAVAAGETFSWRATPEGRLAEVLVLDQFSRQMFRGSGKSFATDGIALVLAQEAVARGDDKPLTVQQRNFLYMPYMHSESLVIHAESDRLFIANGDDNALKFERMHCDVIKRFGRFPKRNALLGRDSTPEELEYIATSKAPF